jgi:dihydrofolate synthase / folylpolyglutamate synthase
MNITRKYIDYLYSLERTGMKYDLRNITRLMKHLGNPHEQFKSIHIAGTNGKGATASFIASIMMEHGLKTGLFTSPHILRFNERIRVNGKTISSNYVINFIEQNLPMIKKIRPSFFEVCTAIAFNYFAEKKVDIAIIECGLGGRLDSTNILNPEVSVITQIGMDHMQFLGNTLKKIAIEKLGIIKPGVTAVVSDNNNSLKPLFRKNIRTDGLFYIDDILKITKRTESMKNQRFSLEFFGGGNLELTTPLLGTYQARNAAAALIASQLFLQRNVISSGKKKITNGINYVIKNSAYMGRLHSIKAKGITYTFDISHNAEGIKESLRAIERKPDVIIFGIMTDKEYKNAMKEILKYSKTVIFTKPCYPRALEPEVLFKISVKLKYKGVVHVTKNLKDSINLLKEMKPKPANILFLGSFFLVHDAVIELGLQNHFKL